MHNNSKHKQAHAVDVAQTLMDLTNLYQATIAEIYMATSGEGNPETKLAQVGRVLNRLEHELRAIKNLHSGVALSDG